MEKMYDYLINKVFTIPYIDKLIKEINTETFLQCVSRYVLSDKELTYGEAISKIYNYMDSSYRNEYYYKNTVFNQLLVDKHNMYDTAGLTELPISESKADFLIINGKGIVYEIKTDLDNFNRLNNQINDYYKAFKYVYVVVGYRQYNKIKEILNNSSVGIYVLYDTGTLLCRKKAKCNTKDLSYECMFGILRKKEFEYILEKHFDALPKVNNFYYYRECLEWTKKINILTFHNEMINCLKRRTVLETDDIVIENIPYELRFYAYFTKENNNYKIINEFWKKKLEV